MAIRCLSILFAPRTRLLEDSIPNIFKQACTCNFIFCVDVVQVCVCVQGFFQDCSRGTTEVFRCYMRGRAQCVSMYHRHIVIQRVCGHSSPGDFWKFWQKAPFLMCLYCVLFCVFDVYNCVYNCMYSWKIWTNNNLRSFLVHFKTKWLFSNVLVSRSFLVCFDVYNCMYST